MPRQDTVFVIHGRSAAARDSIFAFLRSLSLRPLEWLQAIKATGRPSPMISDILDTAFEQAQAVVVLLTGDDEVRLSPALWQVNEPSAERELVLQARPNVLFEAGLALARSPNRTVFVELGSVKPFSDNAGRHVVRLDNSTQKRQELATKLSSAGCQVDLSGTDWHTAGNLSADVVTTAPTPPPTAQAASVPVAPPADIFSRDGSLSTSVELAEPHLSSVSEFTCRLISRGTPFWRFGWQRKVQNRSRGNATYVIECRFLNSDGHVLDSDTDMSGIVITPGETKQLSGAGRVDAELAPQVVRVVAVIGRRDAA